jgi:hypothetical protein
MTLLYTRTLPLFPEMRALRDVDLHRPATCRRRRVEPSNPAVLIPSAAHQSRVPTTHRTNTYLQSHQRNHHYRDCLYNIRHSTEQKYINFGLFEDATCSEPNPNSMGHGAFSSLSRYHLPKKRTNVSSQNPTLQTPSSPKHPGTDAREDPPHQKPREITVDHSHKALLPPTNPEHDATLRVLLGSFRHEASTSVSSARRRRHGVGRGQPLTDPSPGTIPQICSPSPTLSASCPPPFRFTQELLFFFELPKTKNVVYY